MNPKENDNEIIELADEELDEIFADDDFDNGEDVFSSTHMSLTKMFSFSLPPAGGKLCEAFLTR